MYLWCGCVVWDYVVIVGFGVGGVFDGVVGIGCMLGCGYCWVGFDCDGVGGVGGGFVCLFVWVVDFGFVKGIDLMGVWDGILLGFGVVL